MESGRQATEIPDSMAGARARDEVIKLNEFTRQINASSNLEAVLDRIFEYFREEFSIEASILATVDEQNRLLRSTRTTAPANATPEMIAYSRSLCVSLEGEGILARTVRRGKPFYLRRVNPVAFPPGADREIVDRLQLQSFLLLPIVARDKVIALLMLTSYDHRLKLSAEDLGRINRMADQISAAIFNSTLVKAAEDALQLARREREQVEALRKQSERLNALSREVSGSTSVQEIVDFIFAYALSHFEIDTGILWLLDDSGVLQHQNSIFPLDAPRAYQDLIRKESLPVAQQTDSLLGRVLQRRRPLFLRKLPRIGGLAKEREIVERLNARSLLLIPLISHNQSIGLLAFSRSGVTMKLQQSAIANLSRFCAQVAGAIRTSHLLEQVQKEIERSDRLLLNILPAKVAHELKTLGRVDAQQFSDVTIMFTDFKAFTRVVKRMEPQELLTELDQIFEQFDNICQKYGIEKLKTIGDAYMCAGGLPEENKTHAVDACLAATEIQAFMKQTAEIKKSITGEEFWELRLGIHTGPAIAGVIGKYKFAYDVWGDSVNVAARMESSGTPGMINISRDTYDRVKYFFVCEHRGQIAVKNRGEMDMYYIKSIRPSLSVGGEGRVPNSRFRELHKSLAEGATLRFRSEVRER
ncbi:MAG: GAF domain-containing protein [Spirochaetales bacterium]|nr:GAF domain-containing protein [Leptospiraceae bacterium]MCP5482202.1 GAF domain-containing protein [Spirochaetales bacterium]MCP5484686.1 GAF domain-containing protein [Spirochaetales bacterium]